MSFQSQARLVFVVLAIALAFCFHTAVADPDQTVLKPNYAEYAKLCEGTAQMKHPCFSHWWRGLDKVSITSLDPKVDLTPEVFVKDDKKMDFTILHPERGFKLTYLNAAGATLTFSNYNKDSGCFDVALSISSTALQWRLWVRTQNSKGRDLDTMNSHFSKTTFCDSKWLNIHLKPDGRGHGH